jgi:hypothetical protein
MSPLADPPLECKLYIGITQKYTLFNKKKLINDAMITFAVRPVKQ